MRRPACTSRLLVEGGMSSDDPRIAEGAPTRRAFDLLVELGLLQTRRRPYDVAPDRAEQRAVARGDPAGHRGRPADRGVRAVVERLRLDRAEPGAAPPRRPKRDRSSTCTARPSTRTSPRSSARPGRSLLTAQPQAPERTAKVVAEAAVRDIAALKRGVSMRTLYQHSARRHPATHRFVAQVTEHGAQVRTLDEFFNRMIVIDRRIAVIPAADSLATAVVVKEPAMVAYLVDVFDRAFARGRAFDSTGRSVMKEIASEQRAMTIRMLIEGHPDAGSAKRLGVSPRTYAGYVAGSKEEYEAETRFQAGLRHGPAWASPGATTTSPDPQAGLGQPRLSAVRSGGCGSPRLLSAWAADGSATTPSVAMRAMVPKPSRRTTFFIFLSPCPPDHGAIWIQPSDTSAWTIAERTARSDPDLSEPIRDYAGQRSLTSETPERSPGGLVLSAEAEGFEPSMGL
ncbi:hypothetical protein G5V59_18610 [Nocardioides sp. W3-2-3]|uniref:hypothetical protein n=1 Tax=Nocardioides convexus TaxID=2712224 RepID=UPI0024188962|nr:hypothetical protein [Nocardioides convexus]NHA01179.1 hypothetical protein [Nocardioides convexus]